MKSFLIMVLFAFNVYSQSNNQYLIVVVGKAGIMFPGISSWIFTKDYSRSFADKHYTIYPGYYFGLGIESRDLIAIENLRLYFGLDVSYGKSSSGEVNFLSGPSEFEITSLPIMFWTILKSKGIIVPFVKIGLGAERSQLKETYDLNPHYNFDIKDWFFSWGIGAGVDFNYLDKIKLTLFVEGIIKESGLHEVLPDGREIYYNIRNGSTYSGIQIGYSF